MININIDIDFPHLEREDTGRVLAQEIYQRLWKYLGEQGFKAEVDVTLLSEIKLPK